MQIKDTIQRKNFFQRLLGKSYLLRRVSCLWDENESGLDKLHSQDSGRSAGRSAQSVQQIFSRRLKG